MLRTEVGENASFDDLLAQVRTTSLEAYERQDVPLEKIVQRLSIGRDATGTSLVSAMFNLMPVTSRRFELGDLTAESITPPAIDAKFDLSLAAHTGEDDVHLRLDFNQDVFRAEECATNSEPVFAARARDRRGFWAVDFRAVVDYTILRAGRAGPASCRCGQPVFPRYRAGRRVGTENARKPQQLCAAERVGNIRISSGTSITLPMNLRLKACYPVMWWESADRRATDS